MVKKLRQWAPWLFVGWSVLSKGLDWIGLADLVIQRISEPGWISSLLNWLLSPPNWAVLGVFVGGIGWLLLEFRAAHGAANTDREDEDGRPARHQVGDSPFSSVELQEFRSELADAEDGDPTTTGAYTSMRPHLSRRTRWRIESGRYTSAGDPNWKISLLMDQIAHWEEQLAGREWSRAPDAEPPSIEGLGREHMERLESLLDGARRLSKSDPMTRVLHDGGLIFLQRDLQDGTAFFRIHPEIQSDVLTWRRDDIREFIKTNDHIPFQEFLELFTTVRERHQVSPAIFNAGRALGRRKMVEWEGGQRVMIREEMTDVAREVVGLLERRSVVLEKREDSASTSE